MARTESVAVAGYYPTPDDQLALIANVLTIAPQSDTDGYGALALLDPCAGDGAAVFGLSAMLGKRAVDADDSEAQERFVDSSTIYACEMEESRYEDLKERYSYGQRRRALHGDAFRITFERKANGVGLLFLNPPYDTDRIVGRLEEKFLARFTEALTVNGVLVFIVPHYALSYSASTLAKRYQDLACHKFRGEAFNIYKQVVLFARKRSVDLFDDDTDTLAQVNTWATDASNIPELPLELVAQPFECPRFLTWKRDVLETWEMREVDLKALVDKFEPWCESTRARGLAQVSRIVPDLPIAELLHRTYEVATPPRPAHIAAGIAAGLFNGRRIEPDDATLGLPPLLVKGVFDREWRTVEEKHNKEGDKTGEMQVQQPKLVVTILDLDTHQYHTVASSADTSGVLDVAKFGIGDLLTYYGTSLMSVMEQQCKILYDRRTDAGKVVVAPMARKLFDAQEHAVRGCVTLLRERAGRQPLLLGEIGSGKTTVVLAVAKTQGAKTLLVVCPPHLLASWQNEVKAVWPEATAVVLQTVSDVEAIGELPEDEPVIAILSRETAKLGHSWESIADVCPKCGLALPKDEDFAKKHARCEQKTLIAADDWAKLAHQLALLIRPHAAYSIDSGVHSSVRNILRGRLDKIERKRKKNFKWQGLPVEFVLALRTKLANTYVHDGLTTDDVKQALFWLFMADLNTTHLRDFVLLAQDPDDWQRFVEELPLLLGPEKARELAAAMKQRGTSYGHHYDESDKTVTGRMEKRITYAHERSFCGSKFRWVDGKFTVDGIEPNSVEAAVRMLEALTKLGTWHWSEACDEPLYQAVPEPRRYPLAQYITKRHKKLFDFLVLDEGHEYATDGSAQERAAHRLTSLKLPTVLMTGSIMNGYATSLFTNMWALSPEFREEFERNETIAFCDRYGYRKRFVSDRKDGEIVAFGSLTNLLR